MPISSNPRVALAQLLSYDDRGREERGELKLRAAVANLAIFKRIGDGEGDGGRDRGRRPRTRAARPFRARFKLTLSERADLRTCARGWIEGQRSSEWG